MALVTERYESIQYDGTNGRYIAETWLANCALVEDTGTLLTIDDVGPTGSGLVNVEVGGWVIKRSPVADHQNLFYMALSDSSYRLRYVELPTP
ncbi:hypothetical protein [Streptomyces sp. NPDC051310]|uniref:hypothetical protein n=1 Tax=Streptomyces sp. NPDC051310 TaxID=3365649 RepID=UPI0037A5D6A3